MAVTQRKGKNPGPLAASAAAPKGSSKKKAGNVAKREPGTSGAAGAESNLGLPPLLRAALAAAALALSVSCAFVEWPIYT